MKRALLKEQRRKKYRIRITMNEMAMSRCNQAYFLLNSMKIKLEYVATVGEPCYG